MRAPRALVRLAPAFLLIGSAFASSREESQAEVTTRLYEIEAQHLDRLARIARLAELAEAREERSRVEDLVRLHDLELRLYARKLEKLTDTVSKADYSRAQRRLGVSKAQRAKHSDLLTRWRGSKLLAESRNAARPPSSAMSSAPVLATQASETAAEAASPSDIAPYTGSGPRKPKITLHKNNMGDPGAQPETPDPTLTGHRKATARKAPSARKVSQPRMTNGTRKVGLSKRSGGAINVGPTKAQGQGRNGKARQGGGNKKKKGKNKKGNGGRP